MITVRITQKNRELSLPGPASVSAILKKAGGRKSTTLVVCERTILTPDRVVEDGKVVEVISVVSGG